MTSPRSKVRWIMALAAIVVLGIVGFLIGHHDAGTGAQAHPSPQRYEPRRSGIGGPPIGESEVLLYERSGDGAWNLLSTTELAGSVGLNTSERTTTFAAPGELLIQDPGPHPDSSPAIAKVSTQSGEPNPSTNAKGSTSNFASASGLGRRGVLDFVDPSHGITVTGAVCSAGGCSEETELLMTSDGGRTWSRPAARP